MAAAPDKLSTCIYSNDEQGRVFQNGSHDPRGRSARAWQHKSYSENAIFRGIFQTNKVYGSGKLSV